MFGGELEPAPLPWGWAVERLTDARHYWISTTRTDGRPHSRPVWGVWVDDSFCFSTGSLAAGNLTRSPEICVNVENDRGEAVIVEGVADVVDDAATAAAGARRLQPQVPQLVDRRGAARTVLRGAAAGRVRLGLGPVGGRRRRRVPRHRDPVGVRGMMDARHDGVGRGHPGPGSTLPAHPKGTVSMTTIDLDPKLFLPEPEPREVRYTIISVDDHLVEPPRHVRGPAAREAAGPRAADRRDRAGSRGVGVRGRSGTTRSA